MAERRKRRISGVRKRVANVKITPKKKRRKRGTGQLVLFESLPKKKRL
jgi:hypothetical protein